MKYILVQNSSIGQLIAEVNLFLVQGWLPLGGISVSNGQYTQALVIYS